jgi:VWFA-related protein
MHVILTAASKYFRRFAALLMLLALFSGAVPAGAQEDFSIKILDASSNTRGVVRLIVSATDRSGIPIKGLNQSDFQLHVEGQPVREFTIETVSGAKNPLSVLLAVDVSGSMNGEPIDAAKKAATAFLDRLGADDYAALLSFGSGVRLLHEFTSNKASVKQSLEALSAKDTDTWLYEATDESLKKASEAPTSRVAIVLLTDGKDEGSTRTEEEVLGRIKGVRIPVFALGFGEKAYRSYLEEIAGASGGSFLYAPAVEELGQMYAQVYEQLKNQYQIQFRFEEPAGEYVASLALKYSGIEKSARASFLQALAGAPAPAEKSVSGNWLVYAVLGSLGVLILLSLVTFFLHLRSRTARSRPSQTQVEIMIDGKRNLLSLSASEVDSKMTVIAQTPAGEAGLIVELPNATVCLPLVDESAGRKYDEVIITRFDDAGKFQKGRTYLLISDRSVSRPDGQKLGHASVFLNQKSGRYQIKDLGSIGGTRIHGVRLNESAYLENGDRITIGTVSLKYYDMRSGGGTGA